MARGARMVSYVALLAVAGFCAWVVEENQRLKANIGEAVSQLEQSRERLARASQRINDVEEVQQQKGGG